MSTYLPVELSDIQVLLAMLGTRRMMRVRVGRTLGAGPGTLLWVQEGYDILSLSTDGEISYRYTADMAPGRGPSYMAPMKLRRLLTVLDNSDVPRDPVTGVYDLMDRSAYGPRRRPPLDMRVHQSRLTLRVESIAAARSGTRRLVYEPTPRNIEDMMR